VEGTSRNENRIIQNERSQKDGYSIENGTISFQNLVLWHKVKHGKGYLLMEGYYRKAGVDE